MRERTVSRREYYDYIRSDAWRAVKVRYLKSKMPKHCKVCDAPWSNSFVFHHKTYKNLGNERLMDIMPVCRPCHELIHQVDDQNKLRKASGGRYGGLFGAWRKARRLTIRGRSHA